jgi:lipoprotein-anchoring transpeptidase ErfK/SrfK
MPERTKQYSALLVVAVLCVPAGAQVRKPHQSRVAADTLEADRINDSTRSPTIRLNAKGSAVVRAQILLDRARYSCGEIDGTYGSNLEKTVSAYQRDHNLAVNGVVGPETWAGLNADQRPALITYAISTKDEAGPFVKLPGDLMEQAKLPSLGYESALEGLAEKFHASPSLLKALNPGRDFDKDGESILAPNVILAPAVHAASVTVSKTDSSVTAFGADGKVLAYYVATIGSEHDPLPIGEEKIQAVVRNPVFHYDPQLFWNAGASDQKAVIQPGPRNPVGVVWMGLSKEYYGIHGTPAPGLVGHAESHGCVRLTNWNALDLASMVRAGTPVKLEE